MYFFNFYFIKGCWIWRFLKFVYFYSDMSSLFLFHFFLYKSDLYKSHTPFCFHIILISYMYQNYKTFCYKYFHFSSLFLFFDNCNSLLYFFLLFFSFFFFFFFFFFYTLLITQSSLFIFCLVIIMKNKIAAAKWYPFNCLLFNHLKEEFCFYKIFNIIQNLVNLKQINSFF